MEISSFKPNCSIGFYRDGATVGTLDFNGPTMTFTGDAEPSARVFFDYVAMMFAERLAAERRAGQYLSAAANKEQAEMQRQGYGEPS